MKRIRYRKQLAGATIAAAALALVAGGQQRGEAAGSKRVLQRASVSSTGGEAGGGGSTAVAISADGRFVAFSSNATNLVPNDTNNQTDVFVRDRLLGTTERVSVATGGAQATGGSSERPSISADGR